MTDIRSVLVRKGKSTYHSTLRFPGDMEKVKGLPTIDEVLERIQKL